MKQDQKQIIYFILILKDYHDQQYKNNNKNKIKIKRIEKGGGKVMEEMGFEREEEFLSLPYSFDISSLPPLVDYLSLFLSVLLFFHLFLSFSFDPYLFYFY